MVGIPEDIWRGEREIAIEGERGRREKGERDTCMRLFSFYLNQLLFS